MSLCIYMSFLYAGERDKCTQRFALYFLHCFLFLTFSHSFLILPYFFYWTSVTDGFCASTKHTHTHCSLRTKRSVVMYQLFRIQTVTKLFLSLSLSPCCMWEREHGLRTGSKRHEEKSERITKLNKKTITLYNKIDVYFHCSIQFVLSSSCNTHTEREKYVFFLRYYICCCFCLVFLFMPCIVMKKQEFHIHLSLYTRF